MFKKILKVIFRELKLESFEFGGITFYDLRKAYNSDGLYRLAFFTDGHRVSLDFNENSDIYVDKTDIERYISISPSRESETRFYREMPMDSYIRLGIEDSTLEILVKNGIKFHITSGDENLLSVNNDNENLKLTRIKNYLLIKDYSKPGSGSGSSFEVRIPGDSEIRIYF